MNFQEYKSLCDYVDRITVHLDDLMEDLFPVRRSIVSKGNQITTNILKERFKLIYDDTISYPSGFEIGTWSVPNSWDLIDFELKDQSGNVLFNLNDTNLRVTSGSCSFFGVVKLEDLLKRINTKPELPNAIPYTTAYYGKKDWSICLSENEKIKIIENGSKNFQILIKVSEKPSSLVIENYKFKGASDELSLFWTYNCHPQLAQNELSGVAVWAILLSTLQHFEKKKILNRGYFFAIGPETIGAISLIDFFYKHNLKPENAVVLTCLGAESDVLSVQSSRKENSYLQRVIEKALQDNDIKNYKVDSFEMRGSDERQFDFPSVNIETSYFSTKKYHQYPQYHTSEDNLGFISSKQLRQSSKIYLYVIFIMENNAIYVTKSRGEPMLSKIGFWKIKNAGGEVPRGFKATDILVNCDGENDLLSISLKIRQPFFKVLEYISAFEKNGLVEKL